jgi:hypothetical protein
MAAIMLLATGAGASAQELSTIADEKPVTLGGAIEGSVVGHSENGIDRGYPPFRWILSGSLTPSFYGIDVPLSFTISDQERSFMQPFNQFGISPSYKWATVHLGYRSMTMSRYTLAGNTFYGVGAELAPGPFRLNGMYGRFQRAIEEDTTQALAVPTYERRGYAVSVGYKGESGGGFELSYLNAADDTLSLRKPVTRGEVLPAENSALGVNVTVPIIPELRFEAEGGASLLTRDMRAPDLDIDTNDNPAFVKAKHDINSTSTFTMAARTGLTLTLENASLGVGYERIEPGFATLGAYYFTSDIENWTISPGVTLFDRSFRLNGSIGLQQDNLMETRIATTSRVIGSGSLGWDISPAVGLEMQFTNYTTGQKAGRQPVNDSILMRNVTRSGSIAPRLLLQGEEMSHSFVLVGGFQTYTDLGIRGDRSANTDAINLGLNYGLSLIEQPISANGSISYSEATAAGTTTRMIGGSVGGSASILDEQLSLGGTLSAASTVTGDASGLVLSESLNVSFAPSDVDAISLNLNALQAGGEPTYDELTATLSYRRSFSVGE